ncbi:MAG: NAD-dependent epimerase/dehydratase family protein [Candidatus Promineifilaceae bacterium]
MGEAGADKKLVMLGESLLSGAHTAPFARVDDFFSGKKVLVTGATGFIGSHLVTSLLNRGAEVTGIASKHGWRPGVVDSYTQARARLIKRDPYWCPSSGECVESDFRDLDYVVHLAYVMPEEKGSVQEIVDDIRINLLGTARFICQLPTSVSRICFASSIMVYGHTPRMPVLESDCPRPETAYAIGKLATENYLRLFAQQAGISLTILRYATVYGSFETAPRAIPNFIRCVLAGKPPVILGKGDDIRDYVNVSDVVEATRLALADDGDFVQLFNIGTGSGYSTNEIAEKIIRLAGKEMDPIHIRTNHVPSRIVCDITRASTVLGYRPKVQIDRGIKDEISFFANNPEYWRTL